MWPKLRKYAKGQVRSSLSRVEISIRDEEDKIIDWISVTTKDEIFTEVIKWNTEHFAQAKETPFVNGVFGEYLNPFSQNSFSESILDGSIDSNKFEVSKAIQACTREMRYAPGVEGSDPVVSTITLKDFSRVQSSIRKTNSFSKRPSVRAS